MFCPNCHYEYVLGVIKCPDCGADLVYALPPKPHEPPQGHEPQSGYVPVYKSNNLPNIAIAKSLLEDAEIEYISRGGRTGFAYGRLLVGADDAEEARALLAELDKSG